ncbi:MAG: helix-turn-helix transcriptional regulator [Burkholderiales bacterium]|nr:helix-turn-helix transcriptional regulator [Burkholderiales bacterium]
MKLEPRVVWTLPERGGEALDPRLVALLDALVRHATLGAAAREAKLSYRAAWDLLRDAAERFGAPLAVLERGRGARLAPTGEALVAALARAERGLRAGLARAAVQLGPPPVGRARLRLAASHDLLLAQLRDALPASAGLDLELAFTGSLEALAAFARGDADIAGFHVPAGALDADGRSACARWLDPRRDRLVALAEREQGLIVPAGNPRRVKSLADIARKKLRFVNRQPGSGTRLLADALLARSGLGPAAIPGFDSAERTHGAVAGAVAAGTADVGLGLRAAAAEFGLGFVPVARERYLLAVRAKSLGTPALRRFLAILRGPLVRGIAAHLAGYDARGAGRPVSLDALAG